MTDQSTSPATGNSRSAWLSALLAVLVVLYPVLVYLGFRYAGSQLLAVLLIGLFAARLLLLRRTNQANKLLKNLHLMAATGIVLAVLSIAADSPDAMLYYPVIVNSLLLYVFVLSLFKPPSAIEILARLREKDLPPSAIAYTRKATIAWSIFFALNGSISLYTVLGTSLEIWTLYNGLVSYILIGCMFLAELAIRSRVRARNT